MTVTLGKNMSRYNVINKNVSVIKSFSGCVLKEETSVMNPTIIIQADLDGYYTCNYMYIPAFERWYFINDIKSIRNGVFAVSGAVDVLYTYADAINKIEGVVARQQDIDLANLYLSDDRWSVQQNRNIVSKVFSSGDALQNESLILVLGGAR